MTYEEAVKEYGELYEWHKHRSTDIISWTGPVSGAKGPMLFSFDGGKHVYDAFGESSMHLTDEQKRILKRENPTIYNLI